MQQQDKSFLFFLFLFPPSNSRGHCKTWPPSECASTLARCTEGKASCHSWTTCPSPTGSRRSCDSGTSSRKLTSRQTSQRDSVGGSLQGGGGDVGGRGGGLCRVRSKIGIGFIMVVFICSFKHTHTYILVHMYACT